MKPLHRLPRVACLAVATFLALGSTSLAAQTGRPDYVPGPPPTGAPPPLPPEVLKNPPTQPPPDLPDPAKLREQLAMLYELLDMSPERLAETRQTIEMVEAMPPEEREFLRSRLVRLQEDAPALQAEIFALAPDLPIARRHLAANYWLTLREEERAIERGKLKELPPEAARKHLEAQLTAFEKRQAELKAHMSRAQRRPTAPR